MSSGYSFYELPPQSERTDESKLQLRTANSIPQPGPGQVLIRVRALSLNFRDLIISRNQYPLLVKDGELIPVSDCAGEIAGVGAEVEKFKKGDRVSPNFGTAHLRGAVCTKYEATKTLGGPIDGVAAQYIVVPANAVVHLPQHISFEEGATLPCAALTAWNGLFGSSDCPLLPGATVVAEGTGGVSVFAAQFAIASGANVIITSSSDDKLNKVRALFTKEQLTRLHTVNYKTTPDWDKEVLKVSGPDGASHIIEVGGAGTLDKAHQCIKRGGVIANIGFVASGEMPNVPYLNLVAGATYRGILVGSVEQYEDMNRSIEAFKIKPLVDKVFDWKDLAKAYAYQWSQGHVGKVVVKVD